MYALDNLSLTMLLVAVVLLVATFLTAILYPCREVKEVKRTYQLLLRWVFWGAWIDFAMFAYLPLTITLFLGTVGLNWESQYPSV